MISGSGGGGDTQSLASQAATSLASTTVASATAAAVTSIGDSMAGQTSAASTGAMNVGGEGSGGGSGNTGGTGGDSGSIGGTGGEGGDSSRWYAPCEMTPDVMTECAATAACPEGPAVGQRCDLRCADPSLCPPDGTYACGFEVRFNGCRPCEECCTRTIRCEAGHIVDVPRENPDMICTGCLDSGNSFSTTATTTGG